MDNFITLALFIPISHKTILVKNIKYGKIIIRNMKKAGEKIIKKMPTLINNSEKALIGAGHKTAYFNKNKLNEVAVPTFEKKISDISFIEENEILSIKQKIAINKQPHPYEYMNIMDFRDILSTPDIILPNEDISDANKVLRFNYKQIQEVNHSGLMSKPTQYDTDPKFEKMFNEIFVKTFARYIKHFSNKNYAKDITSELKKILTSVFTKDYFNSLNKTDQKIIADFSFSILQHIHVYMHLNRQYSIESIQKLFPYLDFSMLSKWFDSLLSMEVLTFDKFSKYKCIVYDKNNNSYKIEYNDRILDHNSPFIHDKSSMHNQAEALIQTGQQNPDIHRYCLIYDPLKNTIEIINIFFDVKSSQRGPDKGIITLIPHLTDNLDLLKQYMNVSVSHLKSIVNKYPRTISEKLKILIKDLVAVRDLTTKDNLKQSLESFNSLLFKANHEQILLKVGIRLSMAENLEPLNSQDVELQKLIKIAHDNSNNNKMDVLIPEFFDSKIYKDPAAYTNLIKKFLEGVFDSNNDLNSEIRTNVKQFLLGWRDDV